jgi:rare lipoprotein A
MSSISRKGISYADIEASRIAFDRPMVMSAGARKSVQLCAVALTAATLAACAQSPVGTNKSASLVASRQASPEPEAKAQFATNKRVVVVARKHTPFATNKHAAETLNASHGIASFYAHGSQTASGEKFDANDLTAAHRTLPFGTRVRVTNVSTGRSVTVRVNDRGPFVHGRVIDVSHSAAETLGMTEQGVANVKLDVLK